MIIWCDRIVTGGILFLIFFTPLAFGSVHPWAFSLMEGTVFLLVMVWMGRLVFVDNGREARDKSLELVSRRSLFLPLALFISLVLFQLFPLPPYLLHLLSPSTYELYSRSLPGWPEKVPYQDLSFEASPPQ